MNARKLPPLILHPFADAGGPEKLVESSRASLVLQGLLPAGERNTQDIERTLLEGRFCEIRMLFYVGKDLLRWIDQCMELVDRSAEISAAGIKYQSFAAYLVNHAPDPVQAKLKKWGVSDYKSIFSRALGLSAIFSTVPDRETRTAPTPSAPSKTTRRAPGIPARSASCSARGLRGSRAPQRRSVGAWIRPSCCE